jgi:hypothetical protein
MHIHSLHLIILTQYSRKAAAQGIVSSMPRPDWQPTHTFAAVNYALSRRLSIPTRPQITPSSFSHSRSNP